MTTKLKLFTSIAMALCTLTVGAVFATACGDPDTTTPDDKGTNVTPPDDTNPDNNTPDNTTPDDKTTPDNTTPSTKAEWQAQWATYTYSDFKAITDWDSKEITYQFSTLNSAYTKGESIDDVSGLTEGSYIKEQAGMVGPGEDPTYNYFTKNDITETGYNTDGDNYAHLLLNFYEDYSVQIVQSDLDGEIAYVSYGIWDLKAGMGGDYSLKLYYLTKDAASDLTTEVNDSLATATGRFAVELHDVGSNTGVYWIEPSSYRPLVVFSSTGAEIKDNGIYMNMLAAPQYSTVESFLALSKSASDYAKADWQAKWATYTYSNFAAATNWDSKKVVYQFSSIDCAFLLGDTTDTDSADYVAVQGQTGPGEAPVYTYYEKDYAIETSGIELGDNEYAHLLMNFYEDYSVQIVQTDLEGKVTYISYGIWDEKAGMGGDVSLKLYYLTKDAAVDVTTQVNDSLTSVDGRYAIEMHELVGTGSGEGVYWIEPSTFRPLVLFTEDGAAVKGPQVYMINVTPVYNTVAEFSAAVAGEADAD